MRIFSIDEHLDIPLISSYLPSYCTCGTSFTKLKNIDLYGSRNIKWRLL